MILPLSRRNFTAGSLAAMAVGGLALRARAAGPSYRNEVRGYGPLQADAAGFFDLPPGFSYQVIARAGEAMDDGFIVPDNFDGMGCLPLGRGRVALVRNHELSPGAMAKGPAGGSARLAERLAALPAYGRDKGGRVLPGGTSTVVYDLRSGRRVEQYLSLAGTAVNCAGGRTPWGSWLTCEETVLAAPDLPQSHGWIFEVPAARRGLADPVPLKAMGRFRHEAAAVDPVTGIVYLTEDREGGLFYRFLPAEKGRLAAGGRLQALAFADPALPADSRNWNAVQLPLGEARKVRWIDMDEVESPADDLRARGHAKGAVLFARGEGVEIGLRRDGAREFFFTCTSGGPDGYGQIMRYVQSPREGASDEASEAATLELFVESRDPLAMDYADNLTIAPNGHLIVCEDRTDGKINHLKGVTPQGQIYTLARLNADTELAGACFSPDGEVLFVNAYAPGRTLAIRGPWNRVSTVPA